REINDRAGLFGVRTPQRRAGAIVYAASEVIDGGDHRGVIAEHQRIGSGYAAQQRGRGVTQGGAAVAERTRHDDLQVGKSSVGVVRLSSERAVALARLDHEPQSLTQDAGEHGPILLV